MSSSPPSEEEPSKLVGAPILFLVYFHKAVKAELEELLHNVVGLEEGGQEVIVEFRRKFEFFRLVFQNHCAAEDEVIFFVFDISIKNVVSTYMLEHNSIDEMFDTISDCLNVLVEIRECTPTQFQELISNIGTIKSTICQHMLKEEKQVFPLLVQNFSSKEQASLIWQYLCTAPITLLQDIFTWLTSFLSPDQNMEIFDCMKEVFPEDDLLQKVVVLWLRKNEPSSSSVSTEIERVQSPDILSTSASIYGVRRPYVKPTDPGHISSDSLHKWNGVIRKDAQGIMKSLALMKNSNEFSSVDSVIVQLKFFTDVLTLYSTAYALIPMLDEYGNASSSHIRKIFQVEKGIKNLQTLLYSKNQDIPVYNFLENLSSELELLLTGINEYLVLLEREVFPFIIMNFQDKLKQWLLHTIIHVLPLGLLKCIITCFSSHLSEDECNSILSGLKHGSPLAKNYTLEFLLYEWVCKGYSGKISADKCIKTLQEMYTSRNCFLTNYVTENDASFSLHMNIQYTNCFIYGTLQTQSNCEAKGHPSSSSSYSGISTQKYISYSSRTTKQAFSPQEPDASTSLRKLNTVPSNASSIFELERKPVDHIFYFHKALRKELDKLVNLAAELRENEEGLKNFCRRFQHIQFLYHIHSDSEDKIAFPALEKKGKAINISHSYVMDHNMEAELFDKISGLLEEITTSRASFSGIDMALQDQRTLNHQKLCLELYGMCKSMRKILCDHVDREESELWPLFRECLTIKEQEKVIGSMLGRMNAEILQDMIPWVMASLTIDEKQAMMSLWHSTTKNTMFNEWLGEWWEEMKVEDVSKVENKSNIDPSWKVELLEVLSTYLSDKIIGGRDQAEKEKHENLHRDDTENISSRDMSNHQTGVDKKAGKESAYFSTQVEKPSKHVKVSEGVDSKHQEHLPIMSQEELQATIRKISNDSTLDSQKKAYIMQNLLTSAYFAQQKSHSEHSVLSDEKGVPGQSPSYRDPLKLTFGCSHYKRNCKLVASCCNRLFTCRLCHDDVNDHLMDRKATVNMMCMKCLIIQPVGPTCSTPACNNLSMAKYYCRICKLFDDERDINHCPYCNLCRVGKGLGIDNFHCMNCNACLSMSLLVHPCREKCYEDNCPICHEFLFTSSLPVKALSCGHLMHSACFKEYTFTHYICPVCSKSLGDMQVYFAMLDALLAEEKVPDEYSGQTQKILCNDCQKRGIALFHWLHHKCPHCGSYNTRLL